MIRTTSAQCEEDPRGCDLRSGHLRIARRDRGALHLADAVIGCERQHSRPGQQQFATSFIQVDGSANARSSPPRNRRSSSAPAPTRVT